VSDHALSCASCGRALDGFRAAISSADLAPPPFASVRMARALESELDAESRAQRRAWRPLHVVGAAACASVVGACLAMAASGALRAGSVDGPGSIATASSTARSQSSVESSAESPAAATSAGSLTAAAALEAGDALVAAGNTDEAAARYLEALGGDVESGARAADKLRALVHGAPDDRAEGLVGRLLPRLASLSGAPAMGLSCEWGLLFRGDRSAVDACDAFARAHPGDKAVQRLAVATGRVAEERLGDPARAVEAYTRALLVGPAADVASHDALLARARCRADLGQLEAARADLRLYLSVDADAARRDEVRALAARLSLPLHGAARGR